MEGRHCVAINALKSHMDKAMILETNKDEKDQVSI